MVVNIVVTFYFLRFHFQARNSNIGRGNLYVDGPLNPIPGVADLDECADPEMHDCPVGKILAV